MSYFKFCKTARFPVIQPKTGIQNQVRLEKEGIRYESLRAVYECDWSLQKRKRACLLQTHRGPEL